MRYENEYQKDLVLKGLMKSNMSKLAVAIDAIEMPLGMMLCFEDGTYRMADQIKHLVGKAIEDAIKSQCVKDFEKIEKFHKNTELIDAMMKYSYHGDTCVMYTETDTYDLAKGLALIKEQRQIAEEIIGNDHELFGPKRKIKEELDHQEKRLRRTKGSKPDKPNSAFLCLDTD